jgi:Protein of unknown function (DUF3263)
VSVSLGKGQELDAPFGWRDILEFERTWRDFGAPKGAAIRQRLRLSSVRYYQELNRAIDLQAALEYDPVLVQRLRRVREGRRRVRFGPASGPRGRDARGR